jgi:DnaJ-class molecular chaperone
MGELGMSSLYFGGVESLQITRNNPQKCEHCAGCGTIHIATVAASFDCPACHGTGYLEPSTTVVPHDPTETVTVAISNQNKNIKIFLDEKELSCQTI